MRTGSYTHGGGRDLTSPDAVAASTVLGSVGSPSELGPARQAEAFAVQGMARASHPSRDEFAP